MKNFCTNCGTKLKENAKFCHNCGVATSSEYEENMDEFENDNLYKEPTDEDRRSGIELITKYLEKKWENEDYSKFFSESRNDQKVFNSDNLPQKKVRKFIKKNINENESVILDDPATEILYYYDSTVFGSGDNGFLIMKTIVDYMPIFTVTFKELFDDPYTIFLNLNDIDEPDVEDHSITLKDLNIIKNKLILQVEQSGQNAELQRLISDTKVANELFECLSTIFRSGDIRNNMSNDPANIREN
ncbi:zinc ribbon domain-containing protein [Chryseobacterium profundimaris]|uniref:Zinc-ribbon domain-containing protein n=1 Tax=Chryseobacterium profundimaris TaxID=1387275 RepID=A0ABY1NUC5_9FLAO|nr:zinc ribbon domain-containing protein [Chryseobacterium profundimaris]SMP18122.1 zinc-ribbon domain-containing protein [Chryseobacterium profundimaris]